MSFITPTIKLCGIGGTLFVYLQKHPPFQQSNLTLFREAKLERERYLDALILLLIITCIFITKIAFICLSHTRKDIRYIQYKRRF